MLTPVTVSEITALIRQLFDDEPRLQQVAVEGEISNFTRAASGHLYFTLKDPDSELRCVMWRTQAAWLGFEPQHGDMVLARGRVTVYEQRGQYQLYCDDLQPAGLGELNRQFEALKARLQAEGLFDADRKRPVPAFPRRIGVVTSPTTAAFHDIQNVIRRRFPLVEIVLSPTPVQGSDAAPQIIAALERLNRHRAVDVIILARGGGSLEDLWCFNHEGLARAVAASHIPIVAGVGHEIDFTLVDFAADQRAPTPSAAAEMVTPDGAALRMSIAALSDKLADRITATLANQRDQFLTQQRLLRRVSPQNALQSARQRIDDLTARMASQLQYRLTRQQERLAAQTRALEAANPLRLLERGYAIVEHGTTGQRVTSITAASSGDPLTITLHDGRLQAAVTGHEPRTDTHES